MIDLKNALANIQNLVKYGSVQNQETAEAQNTEQLRVQQEGASGEIKQAAEQNDLEFKQQKNQIELLKELVKLFDSGKKKKTADGMEEYEPNPVLELLKKNFMSSIGSSYGEQMETPQPETMIPQEYTPEPQIDPYTAPKNQNSVATTTNDIVGKIANGGQEYMDSGNLEDYLKRYLQ